MNTGWKVWFGLLGIAALFGFVMISNAQNAAGFNEFLATGSPQQTVVGLWHLRDLTVAVIYELALLVVAVASVGVFLSGSSERHSSEPAHESGPVHTEATGTIQPESPQLKAPRAQQPSPAPEEHAQEKDPIRTVGIWMVVGGGLALVVVVAVLLGQ